MKCHVTGLVDLGDRIIWCVHNVSQDKLRLTAVNILFDLDFFFFRSVVCVCAEEGRGVIT